jgi:type IV secretory pathway component VirB8
MSDIVHYQLDSFHPVHVYSDSTYICLGANLVWLLCHIQSIFTFVLCINIIALLP